MVITIENVSLLLGEDLALVRKGRIEIENGAFASIREVREDGLVRAADGTTVALDGSGLLAIPGLIDAHTHIGDSVAKDAGLGCTINELIHPIHGMKTKILNETRPEEIAHAIAQTARDMLAAGITTFADFREGGLGGVELALTALRGLGLRALILGRPNYHFAGDELTDESSGLRPDAALEVERTLNLCSGIGLSGANEYTGEAMRQMREAATREGKIMAIHASESLDSRGFSLERFSLTEVERLLKYIRPDFLVHLTNATEEELEAVAKSNIPVVCCPRANAILGLGFPPILELIGRRVRVALGTDNVMLNAPDMFREMDYTSKMLRALHRSPAVISPKEILKMATVNPAYVLGLGSQLGSIEVGKRADITFVDLKSSNLSDSRDVVASVVHRARADNVKCVMVNGEIVYGSIPRI
ncbi:MAG: amidohydrolase family protein [Nitrososphaerota archaeon]|jgi:cytosine/adenosine deaminase-related metal-dependent hydrolase|nr:amidohydrolase family protein [Nitrososphaerota archaeon]